MKILYVKCNSERAKKFQIKTIVFEDDNQKFVKKEALTSEALVHLKKMKKNYTKLSNSILNDSVKLAKIVDEDNNSLTFEFIEGESLQSRYKKLQSEEDLKFFVNEYSEIIRSSFKTTLFQSTSMVTPEMIETFGELDYSKLDGELCFDGISNIDLIFSNMIYKDETLYIIDYEWCFDFNIPVAFSRFRVFQQNNLLHFCTKNEEFFAAMEKTFINDSIIYQSFGTYSSRYVKDRVNVNQQIQDKDQQIRYWHDLAHSLRIKNRIKKFFLLNKLKKVYSIFKVIMNNPKLLKKGWFHIKQGNLRYLLQKSLEKTQSIVTTTTTQTSNIDISTLFGSFEPENYSLNQEMIYIVIPIYNGYDYLEPLFSSIKRNTKSPYTLVVIDDGSPDERIDIYLKKKLQEFKNVIFLSNEINLGFVQSVNKAVSVCKNHFVILNTDTEVPEHWLERLMNPIIENDRIATTTPFTNSGTIVSFPNFLEDNSIFMNLSVDKLDSYFATIQTKGFYEEIPTGVGFCMGVNYTLVKKIGFFDAETFGKGYGEENDWCQRAIKAGYINIMVPNLFIYHKHGGSFLSEDKKRYIETNLVKLVKKHPDYSKDIDLFIEKNPYKLLRELLIIIISSNQAEGIYLIFDHALGGGANHYRDELVTQYIEAKKKVLEVIYNFYSDKYELQYFYQDTKIIIELLNFEDLKVFLFKLGISEIFINELASFKRIDEILALIKELKKVNKAKLIIPIHDFFSICPSYTLLNDKGSFCDIPDLETCQQCMRNNHLEWKDFFQDRINIESWKIIWNDILYESDEILCFSNSSKDIVMKAYPQLKREKMKVIPHTIEPINKVEVKQTESITIGILGAINYAKGSSVVADLVKLIDEGNLNIRVVVIGEISNSIKNDKFFATGRYEKKDLPKIIQKHNINIFLIPSIWPETFSYTTQEIISMDLPLMVFDLGAPAERVREYEKGIVLNSINVDEIIKSLKFLKRGEK